MDFSLPNTWQQFQLILLNVKLTKPKRLQVAKIGSRRLTASTLYLPRECISPVGCEEMSMVVFVPSPNPSPPFLGRTKQSYSFRGLIQCLTWCWQ